MHFKAVFNNIEHSILSAKNQKMRLQPLETLNYAKYSMLSQKHNAKHADTSYEMIRQRTRSTSHPFLIFSLYPELLHQEGPATVTDTGRKKVAENSTQQNRFKRGVERNIMKTFMIDLSAIRRSERR